MHQKKIILASASPRRKQLLDMLKIPFVVKPSAVDEQTDPGLTPQQVVEHLAEKKANFIANQIETKRSGGIVIGADTIVVMNDEILGKPSSKQDSFTMLKKLQSKQHVVYSGVCLIDIENNKQLISHQATKVTFKPLSDDLIWRYIETNEPEDKAGSYGIQGFGATLVESMDGDYFNVVGLPLSLLADLLMQFNVEIF
ncbi:Maf family protein [Longirhabdus pacifica]|uniref:Maf family protein n=1 Tax=Longirhabdus pacifica TaxID=2305227 RepID=UPI0010089167|nr:Maf family protein [Longirhabdus pacifica]